MNIKSILRYAVSALLMAAAPFSFAEFDPVNDDTDIFLANPNFAPSRPNVLIILDNTANWNTPFAAEKAALVAAVKGLDDSFNVGLMMFTETGGGNGNPDGGYVKFGVRQMTTTNMDALTEIVNGLDVVADKSNGGKTALAMYEAFQYYRGETAYAGANKVKRDFAGNASGNPLASALAGNALSSSGATTYNSPIVDGCQKNYIIYISNGPAQDNSADLSVSEAKLTALNGGTAPGTISLSPNGSQGNWADEWAKYMANGDCNANFSGIQNVITYTMDIGPSETVDGGQGPGWTALLRSMAVAGQGKYFAVANNDANTAANIKNSLDSIFKEVQAVNSVFASSTLPVSVNVRGTNLNQVYIGVFRPDGDRNPRWQGNLKMYKLEADTNGAVYLADSSTPAIAAENSSTGFISSIASSFWTTETCFWSYLGQDVRSSAAVPGSCTVPTTYKYWSDKPDGDKVEKGGAAQRIRERYAASHATRNVYTCTSASGGLCATNAALSATPFSAGGIGFAADNTNIEAADLGAYTSYPVSSINSSGTTATVQLSGLAASWPSPFYAAGNTIKITGASPNEYNANAAAIVSVNSTLGTFTYTLPAALPGNIAIVTATAHGLITGDKVETTSAIPTNYNVTDQTVTRLSANTFSYPLLTPPSTAASTLPTVVGKKQASALSASGTLATLTLPAHGYGAIGNTVTITISGATPAAFNSTYTATISTSDALTFTAPSGLSGATAVSVTTASPHFLRMGDSVTISGSGTAGYNCMGCLVAGVTGPSTFTFVPSTMPTAASSGTVTLTTATRAFTNAKITNGTSPSTKSNITATAAVGSPFNLSSGFGSWTATVTGATPDSFDASGRTITAATDAAASTASFSVTGGPSAGSTASGATLTFTRNSLGVSSIGPVVAATGTFLVGKSIGSVSSVAAQTSATGSITAGRPSDANSTLRAAIINWVRGADNAEGEKAAGSVTTATTTVRPSVHGDVLHSRPAVVNYNRYNNDNDVYAFYGSNDGMIHAVKAGAASNETGVSAGDERWSFVPREFFPKLKRLRDNNPAISSSNPRDYLADGPISIYQRDSFKADGTAGSDGIIQSSQGDKVQLFFGFRRGGRFLYALDVSDPAEPKFLWRKSSSDTNYLELGQTWSEPKVQRLRIKNAANVVTEKVVLIFGGGYDPSVDDVNSCLINSVSSTGIVVKAIGTGTIDYTTSGTCVVNGATGSTTTRTRSQGRALFVVDAADGSVIWQAGPSSGTSVAASGSNFGYTHKQVTTMTCAIPSDVTVVDEDRGGFADKLYVGDVCGNLWRADISSSDPANWQVYQIAKLSGSDVPNSRKFLFPPDVVFDTDSAGSYAAILIGSGDREHPFDTNIVDRFYMIKDRSTSAGAFTSNSGCNLAATAGQPTEDAYLFPATLENGTNLCGWKVTLAGGEKNVGSAVTIAGTTFFNTNQPSSTASSTADGSTATCSNLGIARQYQVSYADASPVSDLYTADNLGLTALTVLDRSSIRQGGGYLPSPVPAVVELGGVKYEVVISGSSVQQPAGAVLDVRGRTYWYKELE